jgi:hypothetical protein
LKCDHCGYISFDYNLKCPNCQSDLDEIRKRLNLTLLTPEINFTDLFSEKTSQSVFSISQQADDSGISVDPKPSEPDDEDFDFDLED